MLLVKMVPLFAICTQCTPAEKTKIIIKKTIMTGSVAIATTAMAGTVSAGAMVALLLPENVNPRWETQDAAAFVRTMGELAPDVKVEVFNANNELQYRGRLEESKMEIIPNAKKELLEAMIQVSEIGSGPKNQIPSIGCSIKWKE
mgnify:CR=1 FL=1